MALCLLAVAFCGSLLAQSKSAEKANELFKQNQFAEAATLYRQAIQEMENEGKTGRSATLLKSKLAYCYRMNNKMDKAEVLYAEVVKDENAKAENMYYYGEALMSNGKYEEAKKWFSDYQKLEPEDEKTALMLRACDYAPLIQPYFQNIDIQEFAYNTDADDNAPVLVKGGLLFSSDRQQGVKLLKEKSGWTGRDYLNLYYCPHKSDGSFGEPGQYSAKLSESNKNTGNASLPADGSEIFFTRNDNELNKQNTYSLQLYSAKSAGENRWKDVEKLPFCSSNHNFMHPAVSPDGKRLFFATNRAGGFGGTDLWVAERSTNGEWGRPENLGPAVNTPANEGFPFVDTDGKLYFCSKGHPGFGGFDIFVTFKDDNGAWQPATNLGKPINSPLDDISIFVNADHQSGLFTSSRSGGDDDIYLFRVLGGSVPQPPVAEAQPAEQQPEEEVVPTKPSFTEPEPPLVEEVVEQPAAKEATEVPTEPAPVVLPKETEAPKAEPTEEVAEETQPAAPVGPPPSATESPSAKPAEAVATSGQAELPFEVREANPEHPSQPEEGLASILDLGDRLSAGTLHIGDRFRINGVVYDPAVWQLTPRMLGPLNKVAGYLKAYPSLQVEISSHTESLGDDQANQRLSENRVATILDYLLREGIAKERILTKGCGEMMPLNRCTNGVTCNLEEHQVNQRIEVKVLALDGRQ